MTTSAVNEVDAADIAHCSSMADAILNSLLIEKTQMGTRTVLKKIR
jgi:hypothetical protein